MILLALVLKLECFSHSHSRAFVTILVSLHLLPQCKALVVVFQFLEFQLGGLSN